MLNTNDINSVKVDGKYVSVLTINEELIWKSKIGALWYPWNSTGDYGVAWSSVDGLHYVYDHFMVYDKDNLLRVADLNTSKYTWSDVSVFSESGTVKSCWQYNGLVYAVVYKNYKTYIAILDTSDNKFRQPLSISNHINEYKGIYTYENVDYFVFEMGSSTVFYSTDFSESYSQYGWYVDGYIIYSNKAYKVTSPSTRELTTEISPNLYARINGRDFYQTTSPLAYYTMVDGQRYDLGTSFNITALGEFGFLSYDRYHNYITYDFKNFIYPICVSSGTYANQGDLAYRKVIKSGDYLYTIANMRTSAQFTTPYLYVSLCV